MPTVSTLKVENILEKIVQSETSLSDVIDMNMHVFENEICSESDITTFHDILSVDDADTRQTRCVLPVLGHFPPDTSPNDTSPPMLFRFVARFARVRIGDSSRTGLRQRHISHGGETSGGKSSGHPFDTSLRRIVKF